MLRAAIFDLYKTLLEVGPPPADAEVRWDALLTGQGLRCQLTLKDFLAAAEQVIAREHRQARAAGIAWPEVFWPHVATEVLPELRNLEDSAQAEFLVRQQELLRTTRLMPGAGAVLTALRRSGVLLGVASNAQPYSWTEFDQALRSAGLDRSWFVPELCFWSFTHGFSKPDPHVFRLLSARLRARGIPAGEILMVGDRLDNDIEPARAQGWQTWRLAAGRSGPAEGDWPALGNFIAHLS